MSGSKLSEERRQYWADWFEEWRRQGGTKKAFCEEHGLALYSFYKWSRRLADPPSRGTGFARVSCRQYSGLRLRLSTGVVLELEPDFESATLHRVLAVLGSRRPTPGVPWKM